MKCKILYIIMTVVATCFSEMHVGGVIAEDTIWNSEDGPYILDSDLLIKKDAKLTISSGTKIIIGKTDHSSSSVQTDKIDSMSIAIKVEGTLVCPGRSSRRITFFPEDLKDNSYSWYGIIFNNDGDQESELAFCDITGAYCGVTVLNSTPVIRACVIEHNYLGIQCKNMGNAQVINCVIAHNFTSGVTVNYSNPYLTNNIVYANRNLGLWCDGSSKIKVEFNLFSGNDDGNFLECDPELGVLVKVNKNRDSVDIANNLYKDPVFTGSITEMAAMEKDVTLPTDISLIKNKLIASIIHEKEPSVPVKLAEQCKYELSRYSPCIDGGNPAEIYNDRDGSRNDIGISGGTEIFRTK